MTIILDQITGTVRERKLWRWLLIASIAAAGAVAWSAWWWGLVGMIMVFS